MAYEVVSNAGGVDVTAPIVVGLFKHASDAHQAVAQLRAQGFDTNQIGAAFRTRARDSYSLDSTSPVDREQESWWDKVKDAFHGETSTTEHDESRVAAVEPEAYGRGEYEYDYADNDFQGSLAGAGIPADRAAYLTRSLEAGGAIVTVRDAARTAEAEQILSANNAQIRHEEVANAAYTDQRAVDTDYPVSRAADPAYSDPRPVADTTTNNVDRMQLFGEVLRVHKDRISRGEVRVRKDVVTENQTMQVPVVREELVLERVAVAGNTPASSHDIGGDHEIRVPLTEEKVRLEKQAVVREEVMVGKREVADVENVSGDVRHDELRVDSDLETPRRTVTGEELPSDVRRHG